MKTLKAMVRGVAKSRPALFVRSLLAVMSAVLAVGCSQSGEFHLKGVFSDGVVLQQQAEVHVRGTASPGACIGLSTDWDYNVTTSADAKGEWDMVVRTPQADMSSHTMRFSCGDSVKTFNDVLIGEVWVASGQANMCQPLEGWEGVDSIAGGREAIRTSGDDHLRFFVVEPGLSYSAESEVVGQWSKASPSSAAKLPALPYFFGRDLRDSLSVPVGIVVAAHSGTPCRSWVGIPEMADDEEFGRVCKSYVEDADDIRRYYDWLATLPSISLESTDGSDPLESVLVYDDYVNMSAGSFAEWPSMEIPGYWDSKELDGFCGVVWFAREVTIPQSWVGKRLKLDLGCIDDRDVTYVNYVPVGACRRRGCSYVRRSYSVPSGIVTSDKVVITVRVINDNGVGGMIGYSDNRPMTLGLDERNKIEIGGSWRYCIAGQFIGKKLYLFGMPHSCYGDRPQIGTVPSVYAPSMVFNKMVEPLAGLGVAGVLWYQGESDAWLEKEIARYPRTMPRVLASFRRVLGEEVPFVMSQIAPGTYSDFKGDNSARLRANQYDFARRAEDVFVVSTLDMGSVETFHTPYKSKLGTRMARAALSKVYGRKNIVSGGPMPIRAVSHNQVVTLTMENADSLVIDRSKPVSFEVAGSDGIFYPAKVLPSRGGMTVFSHLVGEPRYVRYASKNYVEPTLFNSDGEPAPSFVMEAEVE